MLLEPTRAHTCLDIDNAHGRNPEDIYQDYLHYVLNVARKNEASAAFAKQWWRWWEETQAGETTQTLEPLIPTEIAQTLRLQAHIRQSIHSSPVASSATKRAASNEQPRQRRATIKAEDLDDLACAVVDMFEDPDSPRVNPNWTKKDVAGRLERSPNCLSIPRPDGKPRLPKFEARVKLRDARQEQERCGRRARYRNK
jgi:hypothetical protein